MHIAGFENNIGTACAVIYGKSIPVAGNTPDGPLTVHDEYRGAIFFSHVDSLKVESVNRYLNSQSVKTKIGEP